MKQYVYDSGALIAIDSRRDSVPLQRHSALLASGYKVIVPAPVAAQVLREPHRQARLRLALRGCHMKAFGEEHASPVGELLKRSGTSDVVDGLVALTAVETGAAVVTSDGDDIRHLLDTLGVRLPILTP